MRDENSAGFLVVMPVVLIAEDLAHMLREARPAAAVTMATTADQALSLLQGCASLGAAFLDLRAEDIADSGLMARLRELGAEIVLLRDDLPDTLGPCHLLDMPFSEERVARLLQALR